MAARADIEASGLDAVTLDAYGTLVALDDPAGALMPLLPGRERSAVEDAFRAEAEHYVARSHVGRDEEGLALLYAECTAVFNRRLGSSLTPEEYVGALDGAYVVLPGVAAALARLRALGLELAVVGNWDRRLPEHLDRLGLGHLVATIVTSAEAGAPKPDPAPFRLALARIGVEPTRALHVGDSPADEEGARAAGLRFVPAPVPALAERLG